MCQIPRRYPGKVEFALADWSRRRQGPLGSLSRDFGGSVKIERDKSDLFSAANGDQHSRAMSKFCARSGRQQHGSRRVRRFLQELTWLAWVSAQAAGDTLNLSLGFRIQSH